MHEAIVTIACIEYTGGSANGRRNVWAKGLVHICIVYERSRAESCAYDRPVLTATRDWLTNATNMKLCSDVSFNSFLCFCRWLSKTDASEFWLV